MNGIRQARGRNFLPVFIENLKSIDRKEKIYAAFSDFGCDPSCWYPPLSGGTLSADGEHG
jgi:hypothetical protein